MLIHLLELVTRSGAGLNVMRLTCGLLTMRVFFFIQSGNSILIAGFPISILQRSGFHLLSYIADLTIIFQI